MSKAQTIWLTPAMIAAALAVGAGADRLAVTTYETEAHPTEVRFLPDGQTAVAFSTKIGDCTSSRELVYGVDGGVRLNGRETDDATAKQLAATISEARQAATSVDPKIADKVLAVRFLGDGQTALTLTRKEDGRDVYAELVVDVDGGTPRLGGVPIVEEATLKAASAASRALKLEAATVDTATLTNPLVSPARVEGKLPADNAGR